MTKIIISGDFCPNRDSCEMPHELYENSFGYAKELLGDADYSIVNFEAPIVSGDASPILKTGPCLKTFPQSLDILKFIDFSAVTLANNHFFDQGQYGVETTIALLKKNGVDCFGGGANLEHAEKFHAKILGDKKYAFINCCESEFSLANKMHGGSNSISAVKLFYDIKRAKESADEVIVITHGGIEHFRYPTLRMKSLFRFIIDCGASAVINHHQHCYSGYEVYNGKPIFYGIGNFYFPNSCHTDDFWNYGYVVELNFISGVQFAIKPYKQCCGDLRIDSMTDDELLRFHEDLKHINAVVVDDDKLRVEFDKLVEGTSKQYDFLFSPYQSGVAIRFLNRGFLPKLHSRDKLLRIMALIRCESHRDRLLNYLNKIIELK